MISACFSECEIRTLPLVHEPAPRRDAHPRTLRQSCLSSMRHLQMMIIHLSSLIFLIENYLTDFEQTATILNKSFRWHDIPIIIIDYITLHIAQCTYVPRVHIPLLSHPRNLITE